MRNGGYFSNSAPNHNLSPLTLNTPLHYIDTKTYKCLNEYILFMTIPLYTQHTFVVSIAFLC